MSKNNPPMPLEVAIFKLHVHTPAFFTQHVQLNFPFEIEKNTFLNKFQI